MQKKRWYDHDATLSLAVSLIRNTNQQTQAKCAELIMQQTQNFGIVLNSNVLGAFNYVLHRWYDSTEELTLAFEYLKAADELTRKQIALEIIRFLQSIEVENV